MKVSKQERDAAKVVLKAVSAFSAWAIASILSSIYLPDAVAFLVVTLPLWAMTAYGAYVAYFAEVEE